MAHDVRRLGRVQHALERIAEGTYGLSDVSGQPTPEARLEAMPDATNTAAEQAASERSARCSALTGVATAGHWIADATANFESGA